MGAGRIGDDGSGGGIIENFLDALVRKRWIERCISGAGSKDAEWGGEGRRRRAWQQDTDDGFTANQTTEPIGDGVGATGELAIGRPDAIGPVRPWWNVNRDSIAPLAPLPIEELVKQAVACRG